MVGSVLEDLGQKVLGPIKKGLHRALFQTVCSARIGQGDYSLVQDYLDVLSKIPVYCIESHKIKNFVFIFNYACQYHQSISPFLYVMQSSKMSRISQIFI